VPGQRHAIVIAGTSCARTANFGLCQPSEIVGCAKRSVPIMARNHEHGGQGANAPLPILRFDVRMDQLRTVMQEMSERFKVRHTASA
jgi:hypothetical protein